MPDRLEDRIRLEHILDAIAEIERYIEGISSKEFAESSLIHHACIRQLEIIGEACSNLSPEVREMESTVPWRQIIALRNILVHNYFGVDLKVVWDIIQDDLPHLVVEIRRLLGLLH